MEEVFQHVASVLQAIHECKDMKVRVSWIKLATTMERGNFAEVLAVMVERNLVEIKSDPEGPIVTLSTFGLTIVDKMIQRRKQIEESESPSSK